MSERKIESVTGVALEALFGAVHWAAAHVRKNAYAHTEDSPCYELVPNKNFAYSPPDIRHTNLVPTAGMPF